MRTAYISLLFIGLLSLPISPAARDITEAPLNSVVENVVSIGKKQVPLLKGNWKVVLSDRNLGWASGAPLGGVVLVQMKESKFKAAIYITTNLEHARTTGWKRSTGVCDRTNVHFNDSDSNYNVQDADCWQVNHFVVTRASGPPALYGEFAQWIRRNVSTSSLVTLQYFHNDAYDYLRVYYYFDPTLYGFPTLLEIVWGGSDWHGYVVKGDPQREGFIAAVKTLGEKLHVQIRQGFRNKLDGYVADLDLEYPR